jgi:hypothetical protein
MMPPWARATIVIIIAVLLALALLFFLPDASSEITLPPSRYEAELIALERAAVDQAYHDQIVHLFQIWMKDAAGQPQRAITGARTARKAYEDVRENLARREQALSR